MQHQRKTRLIKQSSTVNDAVALIKSTAKEHSNSSAVKQVLSAIPFDGTREWFRKVLLYLDHFTRYQLDERGREQIKTPDRFLIKDQIGDCDDYSTLWAAILEKLGVAYKVKIVKYLKAGNWAHVYIVVPIAGAAPLVLDNVAVKFGLQVFEEVKHVESKLF